MYSVIVRQLFPVCLVSRQTDETWVLNRGLGQNIIGGLPVKKPRTDVFPPSSITNILDFQCLGRCPGTILSSRTRRNGSYSSITLWSWDWGSRVVWGCTTKGGRE